MRSNLKVFACSGKRPAVKSWPTDFVDSSEFILKQGGSYGIICDTFAVVDFDDLASRDVYPDGVFDYFCKLDGVSVEELVSKACLVKTPHGYHLYVAGDSKLPQGQGFKDNNGRDMHVDVRSNGRGYIIGPGSVVASEGKYGEKRGDLLTYTAWSNFETAPFIPLETVFPSLYKLLTNQQGIVAVKPRAGDKVGPSNQFNGTTSWRPASLYDGIYQLASAIEGERNQILFGVARYIKSRPGYPKEIKEAQLDRVREVAIQIGLKPAEIDATIASACNRRAQIVAMDAIEGLKAEDYIRNQRGDIVPNEYNLTRGLEKGDLDVSDFCIDAQDYLIYKPARGVVKDVTDLHDYSESELVRRIDWFFQSGAHSRANFLRPAMLWIKQRAKEGIAEEFFRDIQEEGEVVGVRELWEHMGIESDNKETSIRWLEACLLQSVRRFFTHGSPLENIAILWGPQRTHKSTFINALFDPYFMNPITSERSKDIWLTSTLSNDLRDEQTVGLKIRSMLCLELPELAALKRTSEIAAIRDFITRTTDHYRAPYAPKAELQPRTCTFVGTSNEEPELGDQTGNRRFCLFHVVNEIDCQWIVSNRVAIWRGLYQTYKTSPERTVLTKEENAVKERSLATNAFATIESADFILEYLSRAPTGRLLRADIERYLCTDEDGPRLRDSRRLKSDIDSVMASIGNSRRKGRYSSYIYTDEGKQRVKAWLNFEDGEAIEPDFSNAALEENIRLKQENEELRRQLASMDTVPREDYDDLKRRYLEMASEFAALQEVARDL